MGDSLDQSVEVSYVLVYCNDTDENEIHEINVIYVLLLMLFTLSMFINSESGNNELTFIIILLILNGTSDIRDSQI